MKLSSRSLLLLLAFFLIILSSEFMAAAELNLDYLALQSFRSFADPRGAGLYSWAPRTNLCSGKWLGVFCRGGRVTRLFLSGSNLQGIIHDSLTLLPYLRLLNLSHNHLTGKLPEGFFRLRRLRRIDLSGNSLSGHIPSEIAHLPGLVTLRLEGNRLTGSIPSSLGSFSRIADLNISGNNLFGEIPHASRSFPVSSFSGNSRLCGEPLLRCANNIDNVLQEKHCRKHKAATIASIAAAIIVTILVVLPAVVIYFRKRREPTFKSEKHLEDCKNIVDGIVKEEKKLVFFKGCKPFAADDLLNGWAQTLSQGSIGRMYRVIMEGYPGRGVAVRHLRGVKISAMEQLLSEIGNLRHPNIVDLLAYYCSSGDLFLVYEYLPKRSLHSLLHGTCSEYRLISKRVRRNFDVVNDRQPRANEDSVIMGDPVISGSRRVERSRLSPWRFPFKTYTPEDCVLQYPHRLRWGSPRRRLRASTSLRREDERWSRV